MQVVLNVPGYQGSGEKHWQTCWEKELPFIKRVEMPDWTRPDLNQWVQTLEMAIKQEAESVVIVTHSLGGIVLANIAESVWPKIKAAFIVAPPDMHLVEELLPIRGFTPVPMRCLSFSSMVVASSNDPYCSIENATNMAQAWGSEFMNAGALGHINADSVQQWSEGREMFVSYLCKLKQQF